MGSLGGFFPGRIALTPNRASDTVNRIVRLLDGGRERIFVAAGCTASLLQAHDLLCTGHVPGDGSVTEQTGLTAPAANAAPAQLQAPGMLRESTGHKRGRVFASGTCFDIVCHCAGDK